ncbi:MAG: glycosyltransferase family 39 protein [Bacteroidota bacterium]
MTAASGAWWKRRVGGVPGGVWALAGLAVVARLGAVLAGVGADTFYEYGEIADRILAGEGFAYDHGAGAVPSAYVPPGYVAWLLPWFALVEGSTRVVVVFSAQALVGGATVLLAWSVARRWAGEAAGWASAALYACVPAFVAAAATPSAAVWVHAGALGAFALLQPRPEAGRRAVALGAVLAVLVLFRSEMALVAMLVVGILAMERRWSVAALVAFIVAAGVGPWVARNAVEIGRPTLTTGLGLNLLRGHNAEGIGSWTEVNEVRAAISPGPGYEARMDDGMRDRARANIEADPVRSLRWGGVKVARLWILDPVEPRGWHPLYLASVLILLGLSAVGLRSTRPPLEWWVYIGTSTLTAAVVFAFLRHQVFLLGALVPLAGTGAAALYQRFR